MKLVFVANWKMNKLHAEAASFVDGFSTLYKPSAKAMVGIAPTYTALGIMQQSLKKVPSVMLGAQNCHWLDNGAHTGEVSPGMLKEFNCSFVILGHSERRQFYGETDAGVAKRAQNALKHRLNVIVCVGETREQYEAKKTNDIVVSQLKGSLAGLTAEDASQIIIAYEPVWAIGTGLAATTEDASRVHAVIRQELRALFGEAGTEIPVQYGGSTTPDNIATFTSCPDIHGALIGGAALKPDSFNALIQKGIAAASWLE